MDQPTRAHPYADKFPMLPDGELQELAESIRENGLRQPIVITPDGLILDGRNRAAACELIGVEPDTVLYEGNDLAEYVIDSNVTRRNMSTGARAMATALVLADDGRRNDGRFEYGQVDFAPVQNVGSFRSQVSRAGLVLDWRPDLAEHVVNGDVDLKHAHEEAKAERDKVDAEKRAKAIEANRKREATIRERELNNQRLEVLTTEKSPYLKQVEAGAMSIAAAHAAHQADTEKQRKAERELEMGRKDTLWKIAETVRQLNGGQQQAAIYLDKFYPYEDTYIPEPMRLTYQTVTDAISFLQAVKEGITQ